MTCGVDVFIWPPPTNTATSTARTLIEPIFNSHFTSVTTLYTSSLLSLQSSLLVSSCLTKCRALQSDGRNNSHITSQQGANLFHSEQFHYCGNLQSGVDSSVDRVDGVDISPGRRPALDWVWRAAVYCRCWAPRGLKPEAATAPRVPKHGQHRVTGSSLA